MFYRASEQSEGSGLGLYIVKNAVEKLEGVVSVDSEPVRNNLPDRASEPKTKKLIFFLAVYEDCGSAYPEDEREFLLLSVRLYKNSRTGFVP